MGEAEAVRQREAWTQMLQQRQAADEHTRAAVPPREVPVLPFSPGAFGVEVKTGAFGFEAAPSDESTGEHMDVQEAPLVDEAAVVGSYSEESTRAEDLQIDALHRLSCFVAAPSTALDGDAVA